MNTTSTSSSSSNIKTKSDYSGWGVYDLNTGVIVGVFNSRHEGRTYRASFVDSSHLSGPRKVSMKVTLN
jgi:hypothetical protein